MTLRYLDRPARPLHIAHRGGAAIYPENTMVAFRAAVERHQTDVLELDVHLSRDGVVVVAHDDTLDRCTDAKGPVAARTAAELAAVDAAVGHADHRGKRVGIPPLVEVLRAFPTVAFNIELKAGSDALIEAFVALVRAEGIVERVCCGCEDDEPAAKLAAALPEGTHFYPKGAAAQFVMTAMQGQAPPLDDRYTVLDIPPAYGGWPVVTPTLIEAARATGRYVNVWTIDDADEMRRLLELGVGGIMTDRPDVLRAVLDERGDR